MLNWINKKRNKKGFTLVELVVVIAILGILVALAIPKLSGASKDAAKNAHKANVRMIESAIALYKAENGDILPVGFGLGNLKDANLLENESIAVPKGAVASNDATYTINGGVVYPRPE